MVSISLFAYKKHIVCNSGKIILQNRHTEKLKDLRIYKTTVNVLLTVGLKKTGQVGKCR